MTPIPQPALKPFFQDALSTLYHGHAVEIMALLPAQSVDVVLTSPNYNVSLKYDICNDSKDAQEFAEETRQWLRACKRLLKPTGRLYAAIGDEMLTSGMFRRSAENEGLVYDGHPQHWCKPNSLGYAEWSSSTETFLGFHLGRPAKLDATDDSRNYFEIPTLQGKNKTKGHPCPWNVHVPSRILCRFSSLGGCTVLDCFCGNGASLVVANRLGMKAIGIDISEAYLGNAANAIRRG